MDLEQWTQWTGICLGTRADWLFSLHHVPYNFCAQHQESWPAHQARLFSPGHGDSRRRSAPHNHGTHLRCHQYPYRVCGSARLLPLHFLARQRPQRRCSIRGSNVTVIRTRRFCLNLKNDPAVIAEYRRCHEKLWPKIPASSKFTPYGEPANVALLTATVTAIPRSALVPGSLDRCGLRTVCRTASLLGLPMYISASVARQRD